MRLHTLEDSQCCFLKINLKEENSLSYGELRAVSILTDHYICAIDCATCANRMSDLCEKHRQDTAMALGARADRTKRPAVAKILSNPVFRQLRPMKAQQPLALQSVVGTIDLGTSPLFRIDSPHARG